MGERDSYHGERMEREDVWMEEIVVGAFSNSVWNQRKPFAHLYMLHKNNYIYNIYLNVDNYQDSRGGNQNSNGIKMSHSVTQDVILPIILVMSHHSRVCILAKTTPSP